MAWSLIDSLDSPSSGAFTFTGLSLGSYKRIRIEILDVTVTTDGTDPGIQLSFGSGFVTSGYSSTLDAESSSDTANGDQMVSLASGKLTGDDSNWDVGNASTKGFQSIVELCDPGSTSVYKLGCYRTAAQGPTANGIFSMGTFTVPNAGAIDGIKVMGSSNLTNGFVRIWGMT